MVLCGVLSGLIPLGTSDVLASAEARTKVTRQADLPRSSYAIDGTASQLVESDDAKFNGFAAKVRSDIDRLALTARAPLSAASGGAPGVPER